MKTKRIITIVWTILIILLSFSAYGQNVQGKRISAYLSGKVNQAGKIMTSTESAGKPSTVYGEQITYTGGGKFFSDWSPNGEWIAFEQDYDIWVIPSQGGTPKNLTGGLAGSCYMPFFDPPSSSITFNEYDYDLDTLTVWSVDIISGEFEFIASDIEVLGQSSEGNYIIYSEYEADNKYNLMLYSNLNDSSIIIDTGIDANDIGMYGTAAISPDNSYVVFSKYDNAGYMHMYSVPLQGGTVLQMTMGIESVWVEDFSPDGKWILYSDVLNDTDVLYAYDTITYEAQSVFPGDADGTVAGSFSPDGSAICYSQYVPTNDTTGSWEIFKANFNIGQQQEVYIKLTSPIGGETFEAGSSTEITWESAGVVTLMIQYSTDNGASWKNIEIRLNAAMGSTEWTVPTTPSNSCLIRIVSQTDANISSRSESTFSIVVTTNAALLTLVSPNGNESLSPGDTIIIQWTSSLVNFVKLDYTTDSMISWHPIDEGISASDGDYAWTVPDIGGTSSQCKVRISAQAAGSVIRDFTDGYFTIAPGGTGTGDTYTLRGSLYNGIYLMSDLIDFEPVFLIWDFTDGLDYTDSTIAYNASTGDYSIGNLEAKEYSITVLFYNSLPDIIMPGDYRFWKRISPAELTADERNNYSFELEEIIYLIEPNDNSEVNMMSGNYPSYDSSVNFEWAPLDRASYYDLTISKVNDTTVSNDIIIGESGYTGTAYKADLAPTGIDEHYEFTLYAYNAAGTRIGRYMISYLDGNARNLSFTIGDVQTEKYTLNGTLINGIYAMSNLRYGYEMSQQDRDTMMRLFSTTHQTAAIQ